MGRPPDCSCHCCDPHTPLDWVTLYPDPQDARYSPQANPAEASDAHNQTIIYELATKAALVPETVLAGAVTGSVSVTADGRSSPGSSAGSRRLVIDVTSTDDPWVAGVILWDDSGFQYDPQTRGSISQIQQALSLRWTDEDVTLQQSFVPPSTVGQPWPIYGVAIEQAGDTFISWEKQTLDQPADQCWRNKNGQASDGDGTQYIGRLATEAEGGWTAGAVGAIPDVSRSGHNMGRCDDRLAKLDATTGEWLLDERPDISYDSAVSRPVTKFGIFVGLVSETPAQPNASDRAAAGDYLFDVLISNLIMRVSAWGLPKVFADEVGSPADYGTTYIDEPMDSIPAGWAWSPAAVPNPSPQIGNESWASGGVQEVWDDAIGSRATWGGEYAAFRMSKGVTVPGITDSGTITAEFTWHTIRERDHVKFPGDTADPEESRQLRHGIWLGDGVRILATKEGADWDHGIGNMHWQLNGYITGTGGKKLNFPENSVYGGDDYEYSTSVDYDSGKKNFDNASDSQWGRISPMDGDRVVMILRRNMTDEDATVINDQLHLNVANGVYDQPPKIIAYPEAYWRAYVWVNGRQLYAGYNSPQDGFHPTPIACHFLWFGGTGGGTLTMGLLGMYGGRWSNVRLKARAT